MSQIDCYLNNLGIVQQVRSGAEHDGDCTKQAHTCFVCLVAETEKRAKAFLAAMPDEYRAAQARAAAIDDAEKEIIDESRHWAAHDGPQSAFVTVLARIRALSPPTGDRT